VTVVAFWVSWRSLPAVWAQNRGHGVFAVLLSAALLWRDRHRLRTAQGPEPRALAMIGALTIIWLAGVIISAQAVHLSIVPLVCLAWAAAVFGNRTLAPLAPAAAAFSLALPVWEVLIWPLQMATVLVNRLLIALTPITAEIDGTSIHLPAGTLIVADSCAGLNFLMAALLIGTAYAMYFERAWHTRWRLVAMSAGFALVANWVRVFGLVVLAHVTEMQSSVIKDHATYGWIIFALAMALFFRIAERLTTSTGDGRLPLSAGVPAEEPPRNAADAPMSSRTALAAVVATMVAGLGPTTLLVVNASRSTALTLSRSNFAGASGWTTRSISPAAISWRPAFSGASVHVAEEWAYGGDTVQVDRFVYGEQRQGRELVSDANVIAAPRDILVDQLVGPLDASLRMVREAAIRESSSFTPPRPPGPVDTGAGDPPEAAEPEKATDLRLAWYWYRVAGIDTPSPTRAKLLEVIAFARRSAPSEVIVASTRCSGTTCSAAQERLRRLVGGYWPSGGTSP
jgi:exosortase